MSSEQAASEFRQGNMLYDPKRLRNGIWWAGWKS